MALDAQSSIAIIGTGAAGGVLARSIAGCNRPLACISSRSADAPLARSLQVPCVDLVQASTSDVLILCVPDDAIEQVCALLQVGPGQLVVHCSGASTCAPLDSAREKGASTASLHPLMVLNQADTNPHILVGATAAIDGDEASRAWLHALAEDLGMHPVFIAPEHRTLYHASAALVGGLMSGLLADAATVWTQLGHDPATGARALGPMVRRAGDMLSERAGGGVVMGPVARGDVETIRAHVVALRSGAPHLVRLHRELVMACLRQSVLPQAVQAAIKSALEGPPSAASDTTSSRTGAST